MASSQPVDMAVRVGVREKMGRIPVPSLILDVEVARAASWVRASPAPPSGSQRLS
jgi:hypothetical protein